MLVDADSETINLIQEMSDQAAQLSYSLCEELIMILLALLVL